MMLARSPDMTSPTEPLPPSPKPPFSHTTAGDKIECAVAATPAGRRAPLCEPRTFLAAPIVPHARSVCEQSATCIQMHFYENRVNWLYGHHQALNHIKNNSNRAEFQFLLLIIFCSTNEGAFIFIAEMFRVTHTF